MQFSFNFWQLRIILLQMMAAAVSLFFRLLLLLIAPSESLAGRRGFPTFPILPPGPKWNEGGGRTEGLFFSRVFAALTKKDSVRRSVQINWDVNSALICSCLWSNDVPKHSLRNFPPSRQPEPFHLSVNNGPLITQRINSPFSPCQSLSTA